MNRFRFVPNVPAILSLAEPEDQYDSAAETVAYSLTDGREMVVSTQVATSINMLDLKAGDTFGICKRWDGTRASIPYFDVWATPATEQAKAREETEPETPTAKQPAKPVATPYADPNDARPTRGRRKKVTEIPTTPPEPSLFARGTGTYGPARSIAPMPTKTPARPIPWNVAFREVLAFVTAELKAAGEQWTDQAKQDAVCTILISESRAGRLAPWERPCP